MSDSLAKLIEQQNNLIIRICGLSDPFLEIQAKEEYDMLELQIRELKLLEENKIDIKSNDSNTNVPGDVPISNNVPVSDNGPTNKKYTLCNKYTVCNEYTVCNDIIAAIELTNNISIQDTIKRLKLRPPVSLSDRRLLTIMCNELGFGLDLYLKNTDSINNSPIDTIGKVTTKKYKLYIENDQVVIPTIV